MALPGTEFTGLSRRKYRGVNVMEKKHESSESCKSKLEELLGL